MAVVGLYIVTTLLYTVWLKHVAVIDIVTIAAGFVLRAAAGAVAVDVPMSRWFVLCITFGSLFIVIGKRYAELIEVGEGAGTRATLEVYNIGYLRILLVGQPRRRPAQLLRLGVRDQRRCRPRTGRCTS